MINGNKNIVHVALRVYEEDVCFGITNENKN